MIKYWICTQDGGLTHYTVGSNHRPKAAIAEAPVDKITGRPEEVEWLVPQPDGTVAIDKAARKAKKKARKDAKDAKQAVDDNASSAINDAKNYFNNFDKSNLDSMDDVQDAIEQIVNILKLKL